LYFFFLFQSKKSYRSNIAQYGIFIYMYNDFFCVCFAIVQFEFSRNANVHDDDFSHFYHLIKSSVVVYSAFAVLISDWGMKW